MFHICIFVLLGNSQRGQDECCVRGQWLSLSCQWELPVWMCVCFVVSYIILYLFSFSICSIFWIFQIFQTFFLKSSDLSMVNPHISLNPQNPPIHGAILRFSKDFYCEIHGFLWQSSDLARDLFRLNPQADLRSSSSLSGSQFDGGNCDCLLHNLCSSDKLRFADGVHLKAGLSWTQI